MVAQCVQSNKLCAFFTFPNQLLFYCIPQRGIGSSLQQSFKQHNVEIMSNECLQIRCRQQIRVKFPFFSLFLRGHPLSSSNSVSLFLLFKTFFFSDLWPYLTSALILKHLKKCTPYTLNWQNQLATLSSQNPKTISQKEKNVQSSRKMSLKYTRILISCGNKFIYGLASTKSLGYRVQNLSKLFIK